MKKRRIRRTKATIMFNAKKAGKIIRIVECVVLFGIAVGVGTIIGIIGRKR